MTQQAQMVDEAVKIIQDFIVNASTRMTFEKGKSPRELAQDSIILIQRRLTSQAEVIERLVTASNGVLLSIQTRADDYFDEDQVKLAEALAFAREHGAR